MQIAGENIQLPTDAYYYHVKTVDFEYGPGVLIPTPFYLIERGDSRIFVTVDDGLIWEECVAPDEQGAFDFVWEALQEHNPGRPLQDIFIPCGPETAGSTIEVAGEMVQLPLDIHVRRVLWQAACPVDPCPIPPSYELAYRHPEGHVSLMAVDRFSGRVSYDTAAFKGATALFDDMKRLLAR